MKDCSHHIKPKNSAWNVFYRFVQSPQGINWLEQALADRKKQQEQDTVTFIEKQNEPTANI